MGSGVIVSRDGYIATAGHLITKPGQELTVTMADGKTHKGTTLGFVRVADSGLAKITDAGGAWPWRRWATRKPSARGPGAWPWATPWESRRDGRRSSAWDACWRSPTRSSAPIAAIVAGDSGGPLVDLNGRVIAINVRIGALGNQNYHEPINVYRQAWKRLAAGEAIHVELSGKDSHDVKTPCAPW